MHIQNKWSCELHQNKWSYSVMWRLSIPSQKLNMRKANPISPFNNRVATGNKNCAELHFSWKHPPPPSMACGTSRKTSKIKSRSTASARLSAYAPWVQTHRQNSQTGNNHPLLQVGDRHTHKRMDGWTDSTKYIISLPVRSIMRQASFLLEPGLVPLLPLGNVESPILLLLHSAAVPVRSTPLYQITPSLVSPDMNDAYHAVLLPLKSLWNSKSMCMREGAINN